MKEKQRSLRLKLTLDKETYALLSKQASDANISLSTFSRNLFCTHYLSLYAIQTHDLSGCEEEVAEISRKIEGSYNSLHESITEENVLEIESPYKELSIVVTRHLSTIKENREVSIQKEGERIKEAIKEADKPTKIKSSLDMSSQPKSLAVTVMMTEEELDIFYDHKAQSGYGDAPGSNSEYARDLIRSHVYMRLSLYTYGITDLMYSIDKPLRLMNYIIRRLIKHADAYIKTIIALKECKDEVDEARKGIWDIVIGDRVSLYNKYGHRLNGRTQKGEHERKRKQKGSGYGSNKN